MLPTSDPTTEQTARVIIPAALLAQLRERRAQERALQQEQALATKTPGLSETANYLGDLSPSASEKLAIAFVEEMVDLQREVEDQEDAFLLNAGMGPMTYLTTDGRVLRDHRTWDSDELREATLNGVIAALVVGASNTGIADLLSLVPACPDDGSRCSRCEGGRWDGRTICGLCCGRGWMTPALLEASKATGWWPQTSPITI